MAKFSPFDPWLNPWPVLAHRPDGIIIVQLAAEMKKLRDIVQPAPFLLAMFRRGHIGVAPGPALSCPALSYFVAQRA
jgi:hypothetical protein